MIKLLHNGGLRFQGLQQPEEKSKSLKHVASQRFKCCLGCNFKLRTKKKAC